MPRQAVADLEHDLFAGLIRLHVLYHAVHEPVFGLEIIEELGRHGYHMSPGTIYPILHSMEQQGLLRSQRKLRDGRFRRVYRATAKGGEFLKIARTRVMELFGELFEVEGKVPLRRSEKTIR